MAEQEYLYEVWTDEDRELAMHYGAASSSSAFIPDRITVLLDANGDLLLEYLDGTSAGSHPQEVLDDCELLFGDGG